MRLIAEGVGDDVSDHQFRVLAVNTYVKLLEKYSSLHELFVQVIAWILGEYVSVCSLEGYTTEDILDLLCDCLEENFTDSHTRLFLVSAICKIVLHNPNLYAGRIENIFDSLKNSTSADIQQRVYEFLRIRQTPELIPILFPLDSSMEDVEVDVNLAFLNTFVQQRKLEGEPVYKTASERRQLRQQVGHFTKKKIKI